MRWTVLDVADLVRAFRGAAYATSAAALLDAFAADFLAPAQNVVTADRQGNIGIRSTGHFPVRPGNGSGLVVRDGSLSANDWQGFWPVSRYPQAFNPPQGFVASANQQPIDPQQDGRYLGYDSGFEPWRALQINRLLRQNGRVTIEDMRRYQWERPRPRCWPPIRCWRAGTGATRSTTPWRCCSRPRWPSLAGAHGTSSFRRATPFAWRFRPRRSCSRR
jgi:penicillin amidase